MHHGISKKVYYWVIGQVETSIFMMHCLDKDLTSM